MLARPFDYHCSAAGSQSTLREILQGSVLLIELLVVCLHDTCVFVLLLVVVCCQAVVHMSSASCVTGFHLYARILPVPFCNSGPDLVVYHVVLLDSLHAMYWWENDS